ncbi:glycogen debranching N-terminal domain-containing protein [Microlunatus panaciterrae]|uniref:Amylo-alpha-1,6-glucosidase n=1 Tax=Microlunatus panaciterrae TaxID=400768 RepID=A0ABS2RI33_9ACTN|nr:glycogen debranching N-terminal domain-containing protein [Microlunatus panaciterrae]MBM7798650.1 hypothetical protein [Microlunatus panaciterrae]
MPQKLQPFLHDLVTTFAAPTQTLSAASGDVSGLADGPTAQGVLHADIRVLSDIHVLVDGKSPEHIATQYGADTATFTSLLRNIGMGLVSVPDRLLRLDRTRRVSPGLVEETLFFSSDLPEDVQCTVEVVLRSDFTAIEQIRNGEAAPLHLFSLDSGSGEPVRWSSGEVSAALLATGADLSTSDDGTALTMRWALTVPAKAATTVGWQLAITDSGGAVIPAPHPGLDIAGLTDQVLTQVGSPGADDHRLRPWVEQSLADLNSLRMATAVEPELPFYAAGAPWYLTLFGRDSLWTARLLLPVDLGHALSTLRTLARFQGTKTDIETAEQPGKIMHELRRGTSAFADMSLPPLYYGTIDATALWICLLHDVWKAGAPEDQVRQLLPNLTAALQWMGDYGDADGDGFLEYIDESGHGLANQGWKDSGDSVRFADGTIATGPVALCEVQAYAYQAAVGGAELLDHFGQQGGDHWRGWAAELADRFRAQFWCGEGDDRFPALALDGQKRRVDSVTSNIGHLLGTGILSPEESELVARRVTAADMDSGLGLRTMSAAAGGYTPLSYHCGSVWPHDTAIVIDGLVRSGLGHHAGGLVQGLLQASTVFDRRFPELWSGEGTSGVPYPSACRPQAWSAAAAITVANALSAVGAS